MPNPVVLSGTVYLHFGTSSATTGAATNADSTPTVAIAKDGVAMGYAPTVTNVATGLYIVSVVCSAGNGFAAGSRYSAYVTATVGAITGRDGIGEWEVLAVDLNTGVASVSGLTASNLDVAVSTRMATYTQPAGFLAATFPSGTIANTTNLTAGTITTVSGNVNGSVGSVVGLTASNLDVAVSTRLATASYTAPDNATIATINTNTDTIESRLPAALVGGRIDASVGAMAADVLTASALATDAVNEIIAAIFANTTDGTFTFAEMQRLMASSILAVLSGAVPSGGGTATVKNIDNTKTRFTWSYDGDGNRTGFTVVDKAA